jgi:integrase
VATEFVSRHLKARNRAPAYITAVERRLGNHVLPVFGDRGIRSIARRELIALLDRVHDDAGPEAANATLAAMRALFRWANRRDLVEAVPTVGILPPGAATRRDRVLSDAELARVLRAARQLGHPFGSFTQLLILTALRRNEAANLRWDEIDLTERLITLPAERTKSRRAHLVPLAPTAIDLLARLPRTGTFVMSVDGSRPISTFSRGKRRIDHHAPMLAPWTLHDLRRSAATGLARLGVARFVISRILAHSDREVTGIYDRYEYLSEKRAALEQWAVHTSGLLHPHAEEAAGDVR